MLLRESDWWRFQIVECFLSEAHGTEGTVSIDKRRQRLHDESMSDLLDGVS